MKFWAFPAILFAFVNLAAFVALLSWGLQYNAFHEPVIVLNLISNIIGFALLMSLSKLCVEADRQFDTTTTDKTMSILNTRLAESDKKIRQQDEQMKEKDAEIMTLRTINNSLKLQASQLDEREKRIVDALSAHREGLSHNKLYTFVNKYMSRPTMRKRIHNLENRGIIRVNRVEGRQNIKIQLKVHVAQNEKEKARKKSKEGKEARKARKEARKAMKKARKGRKRELT